MTPDQSAFPIPSSSGSGTATPDQLAAQIAAEAAATGALTALRASAEKWQAAIAAILGLFALSGLIKGPDDFAKVDPSFQPAIVVLLAVAVVAGVAGTGLAASAAYGLPTRAYLFGDNYTAGVQTALDRASERLKVAIGAALLAYLSFALTVGILWFAPRAEKASSFTLVTSPTGLVCGDIKGMTSTSVTIGDQLTATDVAIPAADVQVVQTVSACPKK